MMDEEKKIINAVLLCLCAILLIGGSSWNYIIYKMNERDYVVYSTKILRQESLSKASSWAVVEYFDENIKLEGKVIMNFWERKGDEIKVAFHKNNKNFIRPNFCLDGFSAAMLFWCVGLSVYFVVLSYNK